MNDESQVKYWNYHSSSGFIPEVIRMASDSVIGLESKNGPNTPLYCFQEDPSNSNSGTNLTEAYNFPSSETEYSNAIESSPSADCIANKHRIVNTEDLTTRQRNAQDIARKAGFNLVFEELPDGENGYYDPKTKTIHISVNDAEKEEPFHYDRCKSP